MTTDLIKVVSDEEFEAVEEEELEINPEFTFDDQAALADKNVWNFNSARLGLKQTVKYSSIDELIKKTLEAEKDPRQLVPPKKKLQSAKYEESLESESDESLVFDEGVEEEEDEELDDEEGDEELDEEDEEEEGEEEEEEEEVEVEEVESTDEEEKVQGDEDLNDRVRPHNYSRKPAKGADSEDTEEEDEGEKERREKYFDKKRSQVVSATDKTQETFGNMNISRPILKALTALNFSTPTPIQSLTIPVALLGKDVCAGAVTGSGKTAAFLIPILERLLYKPRERANIRVLILCPTRELAMQCHSVAEKLSAYVSVDLGLCVGGLSLKAQEKDLKKRPDIVIATPGRLIDHLRNSPSFNIDQLEILVMDEADRMLEEGFKEELTQIINSCPKDRQTMLFSATMTDNVDELIRLSLKRPVRLQIDSSKTTADNLTQEFIRIRPNAEANRPAILLSLASRTFTRKCLIFFKQKNTAREMKILFGLSGLNAAELHGNLSQEQRLDALENFRDGKVDFLMATDLAARGLDIKGIETVINYNLPTDYKQYLHRIGRTARAGESGKACTLAGEEDRKLLRQALKNAKEGSIFHRVVPAPVLAEFSEKITMLQPLIQKVQSEEKQDRALRQADMEISKAKNMLNHSEEIAARPARTWFKNNSASKSNNKRKKEAPDSKQAYDDRKSVKAAKKSQRKGKISQFSEKKKGGGGRGGGLAEQNNRSAGPKKKRVK